MKFTEIKDLKIGDRVYNNSFGAGTVKVFPKGFKGGVGIEFDNSQPIFHSLVYNGENFAKKRCGYWCQAYQLIKIEEKEEPMKKEKIVIKREGDTVTAYMGKKQAVAKCSPTDTFDLYKGSILALTRLLLEGEENGGGKEL